MNFSAFCGCPWYLFLTFTFRKYLGWDESNSKTTGKTGKYNRVVYFPDFPDFSRFKLEDSDVDLEKKILSDLMRNI